mgnify:CR=1 FL=1
MRLFIALYPPDEARRHLRHALGPAVQGRRVRLTATEKWHITLAFLGEVPEERLPELRAMLAAVDVPKGRQLRIRGGGDFRRRVTWAGVDGDLSDLAAAVGYDGDSFTAHLTVAYAHDAALSAALADYVGPAWTVDEIALVHSAGGAYTTLGSW